MTVTAKMIAEQLGLSPAAVSLALNNRPGVSAKTRAVVIETARSLGFDFSKLKFERIRSSSIELICYSKHQIFGTSFFSEMVSGIEEELRIRDYRFTIRQVSTYESVRAQIASIADAASGGVILLATEMNEIDLMPFAALDIPLVLLDTCISAGLDRVQINNREGSRIAVEYLSSRYGSFPGYLRSSARISNFEERLDGYLLALRLAGGSAESCIVHELGATVETARNDMLAIIDSGTELSSCYLSDFDDIAIGAIQAFAARGYRIPQDIGFIGFDNSQGATNAHPSLSTINVPAGYMGAIAARRLVEILNESEHHPIRIEIGVSLIRRESA
ncbi:transcriptional regulator, LacI family [Coriobacterium glomerans PW2]|uniref:Transcriptional regulator, LacI family n=1 Tax=Coriobacterium glomerans (strain ATCC 49209 / DSM 20642 / JCM 10262 / PW2) TaxID=700015 RepID=F2N941_CORGP|nr:LacI family DNA-binding transcriptional regulator [Coriobacterium glomerans]AEB07717.1 transcriptional regulator, LacI family [Coriobacterium glomerans PW2]